MRDFGQKILPEGLIEKGEITNSKDLSLFLKKSCRNIGMEYIVAALPEEKAFVSLMNLPEMEKEFLRSAVESQLEEYVPLAASEAVFDFEVVFHHGNNHKQKGVQVVVVAYPRRVVESYRNAFHGAGLKPIAFEMEAYALRRAVLPEYHKGTDMIIDFGRIHTSFAIVHDGLIRFASTISVAGNAINEALKKRFSVDYAEAERIKENRGMIRSKSNIETFNAILPVASAIVEEIQRHIIYWDTHAEHAGVSEHGGINRILLAGGDANLAGFPEYAAFELKLPVAIANPWLNIASFNDYVPAIPKNKSLVYANVLGLALRALKGSDV